MNSEGSHRARACERSAKATATRCLAMAISRSRTPASFSAVARSIGSIGRPGIKVVSTEKRAGGGGGTDASRRHWVVAESELVRARPSALRERHSNPETGCSTSKLLPMRHLSVARSNAMEQNVYAAPQRHPVRIASVAGSALTISALSLQSLKTELSQDRRWKERQAPASAARPRAFVRSQGPSWPLSEQESGGTVRRRPERGGWVLFHGSLLCHARSYFELTAS